MKVLVVEDFESFRQFVCSTLHKGTRFQVTEASDGLEAVRKIEEVQPDLILLDIGLPNLNGIEVAKCARKIARPARILFLSQEGSPDVVREAFAIGAQGYVQKLHVMSDLLPAIAVVLKGEHFVTNGLCFSPDTAKDAEIGTSIYPWQQKIMDAFKSPAQFLPAKINLAERAIAARLVDSNQTDMNELLALKRALRSLTALIAESSSHVDEKKKEEIA